MNERDFIYWLQGFLELSPNQGMTSDQLDIVKNHIHLVLTKVTPDDTVNPPTKVEGDQLIKQEVGLRWSSNSRKYC